MSEMRAAPISIRQTRITDKFISNGWFRSASIAISK